MLASMLPLRDLFILFKAVPPRQGHFTRRHARFLILSRGGYLLRFDTFAALYYAATASLPDFFFAEVSLHTALSRH